MREASFGARNSPSDGALHEYAGGQLRGPTGEYWENDQNYRCSCSDSSQIRVLFACTNSASRHSADPRPIQRIHQGSRDLARASGPAVVQISVRGRAALSEGDVRQTGFVADRRATGRGAIGVIPQDITPTLASAGSADFGLCGAGFASRLRSLSLNSRWPSGVGLRPAAVLFVDLLVLRIRSRFRALNA